MNSTSMWLLSQLWVFGLLKQCSWEFSSSGTLPAITGCLFPSVLRPFIESPLLQGSLVQWRMLGEVDLWNIHSDYDWWLVLKGCFLNQGGGWGHKKQWKGWKEIYEEGKGRGNTQHWNAVPQKTEILNYHSWVSVKSLRKTCSNIWLGLNTFSPDRKVP